MIHNPSQRHLPPPKNLWVDFDDEVPKNIEGMANSRGLWHQSLMYSKPAVGCAVGGANCTVATPAWMMSTYGKWPETLPGAKPVPIILDPP